MAVHRVFVEKKPGVDIEAQSVFHDLVSILGLKSLKAVRVLNCYDVENITPEDFADSLDVVFSEPPVDVRFDALDTTGWHVIAVRALPGQFDQRADSAAQCVQILTQKERPLVQFTRVFLLQGDISSDDLARVRGFLINPVETGEVSLTLPKTLHMILPEPAMVETLHGFIQKNADEIAELRQEMGLAQTLADILFVQSYFQKLQRDPTITEIRVIDTYWSDHCRHTTFLTRLDAVTFDEGHPAETSWRAYLKAREPYANEKNICLMDIALAGMKALKRQGAIPDLDESEEINACSIVVDADINGETQQWLVMFKNETHNHPTEIEPFGGAATCLGGAIRDPLSGRSYVYQAMRITGAGDPRTAYRDTLPGKLPQRTITRGAAAGYSAYGNQIGLATGLVHEVYHPGFVAKRLEIGAVVGAAPREHVRRDKPLPGDVVVLLGGRTGRDGIGGATGSSKEHTNESLDTCGAEVQKGNPPTERKLQRLFRNREFARLVKRCNDFGAGGVCVAIGELADGLCINLDCVPRKYDGLDGTELAISESQERMAVVVAADDVEKIAALADMENLETSVVATITEEPVLNMQWRGQTIVAIERAFLDTNGATQTADAHITMPKGRYFADKQFSHGELSQTLADLNVCSQKGLAERFDASIGVGSLLMPYGGAYQMTPTQAMAAALPVEGARTGTVMGWGYDPQLSSWSPYHGAVYAIVDAVARVVASGGDHHKVRLTLQEYFERLQDNPTRWGKPVSALLGAFSAQMALGLPAIGGKDSMSGTFMDMDVPPTLVAFALAPIVKKRVISPEFKKPGRVVYWKLPHDAQELPDYKALHECYDALAAMPDGAVTSAWAVGAGGVWGAVCQMGFGNRLGFRFADQWTAEDLQEPAYGSLVLALNDGVDLPGAVLLGEICQEPMVYCNAEQWMLEELQKTWEAPLEPIFPTTTKQVGEVTIPAKLPRENAKSVKPRVRIARPRVLIPVFPGTNCEVDTARVFEKAGAIVDTLVVRNLTSAAIGETLETMVKILAQTQILMLPGGFSGGDEPDGSGKFIATALRNPKVADAVREMLIRDGLALGICNGFQALVKVGLLPHGDIRSLSAHSPTLTFNTIGRHVSCMVRTRIASNRSPWLAGVAVGDVHTVPVSHGEGRFMADEADIAAWMAAGQIATQYVDEYDKPTMAMPWNPNGSMAAIEGLLSPDGRVFGKMAHSERTGEGLLRNVPGEQDQRIFVSGVEYFL